MKKSALTILGTFWDQEENFLLHFKIFGCHNRKRILIEKLHSRDLTNLMNGKIEFIESAI